MTAATFTRSTGQRTLGSGGDTITFTERPRLGVWIFNSGTDSLWIYEGEPHPGLGAAGTTEIPGGAHVLVPLAARTGGVVSIVGTLGTVYSAQLN